MMKKLRLADVLKLTGSRKWAGFHRINTNRDGNLLETISMKNKTDVASVAQLAKLLAVEQKKANYDHVVTLLRTIRRHFLDNEGIMRLLVKEGLDTIILTSISELRKNAVHGIDGKSPTLRLLLVNVSDMFEWDFFGDGNYKSFLDELLSILTSCNDSDDSLFSEAACVMMSMCSTNISAVFDCLNQVKSRTDMLEKVLHDLPRAKSFFYEALVLELIYRLHRYSKKTIDSGEKCFVTTLINAFPVQIAHALPDIAPKAFRDETRRLLNELNGNVGVITSLRLEGIDCSGQCGKSRQIQLYPAGWIDIGGTVLEIEVNLLADDRELLSTFKLPYKTIASATPHKSMNQIMLTLSESICLADILDGVDDPGLSNTTELRLRLSFEREVCSQVMKILDQRMNTSGAEEFITVESSTFGGQLSNQVKDPSSTHTKVIDTNESRIGKCTQRRPPSALTAKSQKPKQKEKAIKPICAVTHRRPHATTSDTDVQQEECTEAPESDPSNTTSGCDEQKLPLRATTDYTTTIEQTKLHSQKHSVIVVPHDEDLQEKDAQSKLTDTVSQKQSFRTQQAQHLRRLKSIVEDIMKTNDQFRHFNMSSLCHQVVDDTEALLKRKREAQDGTEAFGLANASILHRDGARGEELSRRISVQEEMNDTITTSALTENEVSTRAEKILKSIQKTIDQDCRHQLDRVQKKLRAHATQCTSEAKDKLVGIEKSFNTDDLRVMQQMLQRI